KLGEDKAPWYVGWYEPDGTRRKRSFGAGWQGKKRAERERGKLENELMCGTYQKTARVQWDDFVREHDRKVLAGLATWTRSGALAAGPGPPALASGGISRGLAKPVRVRGLSTGHVDDFIAERRKEPGKRKGEPLSGQQQQGPPPPQGRPAGGARVGLPAAAA